MRIFVAATAALLLSATAALAAPTVSVTVGPELQAKAVKTYGVREIDRLAGDLQAAVERSLARPGALDAARVELVLVDAKPNRPTFKELGDKSGLSMQSLGIGGASIEGRIVATDGSVRPVTYHWYENDIRDAVGSATWSDAYWTFNRFARRLAKGDQLATR